MLAYRPFIRKILSKQIIVTMILLVISFIIAMLAHQVHFFVDLTQNQRNSLAKQSQQVIAQLNDPIEIKVLASNSPNKGKYFRKSIQIFIGKYQQYKKNIQISFISPVDNPSEAMRLGLKQEGDVMIFYKQQQQAFGLPYTEERFTNALLKLHSNDKNRLLFFTTGHDEPLLHNTNNQGWSTFAKSLESKGIRYIQSAQLNNLKPQDILLINAPRKQFNDVEIKQIQQHIKKGGHLVWLLETDNLQGLEALANIFNIEVSKGITVDLSYMDIGLSPHLVNASHYAKHEIFTDFSLRTMFNRAHRVSEREGIASIWQHTPLIGVAENGWLTRDLPTDYTKQSLASNLEKQGPINIAVALERLYEGHQQRVIIVGNSQFLSNQMIAHGGNLGLAYKLLEWVSNNQHPISIRPQLTRDAVVIIPTESYSRTIILAIFNSFQFLLPAILFIGAWMAWRRKTYS